MLSSRQAICIIVMFMFGSSVIMGVNTGVAQDSWICVLLAPFMALPMVLIYARIIKLFPEKDFFEIVEIVLGRIAGKIIVLLMSWYGLHLCALVLRNFAEFIGTSYMLETPQLVTLITMILVVVYMLYSGAVTLGKWCLVMLPILVFVVIITAILPAGKMDFTNLMPVLSHSAKRIAESTYQTFTFPYAETVLFLSLAGAVKKTVSPYKIYVYAIFIGTAILLLVVLRNILLMGPAVLGVEAFPSYVAVRIISIGDFIARVEGSIAMNLILAGIVKISVCLYAATKGTARLFGIANYRKILFPMSLSAVALSIIIYKSVMDMFAFVHIYTFYVIPFQIIIPLLIWIAAEIKVRREKPLKTAVPLTEE